MKVTISLPIVLFAALQAYATTIKVPLYSKSITPDINELPAAGSKSRSGGPLTNSVVKVTASVKTSSGQVFKDVLIDTGSAILWVGGEKPYQPGLDAQSIDASFSIGYGTGGAGGPAYRDNVAIGNARVTGQIIGAANATAGFTLVRPIDGILGLGPSGSNFGQVSGPYTNMSTPTFVESLVTQGSIKNAIFGVFISPLCADGDPDGSGELTFGGIDENRIRGEIIWVAQNPPVNFHWEFNVTSFNFGSTVVSRIAPARTDTGVLGILIPFDSYIDIREKFNATISKLPPLSGYLAFPSNKVSSLPELSFTLGVGHTFSIPPSRYLIPQNMYARLNLSQADGHAYSWISSAGPGSYLFGLKWLENVYTAYDRA